MSWCLIYSWSTWCIKEIRCTKEIAIELDHFAGDARGSSLRIERHNHRVKRGWGLSFEWVLHHQARRKQGIRR
jgi:hypothetical protein